MKGESTKRKTLASAIAAAAGFTLAFPGGVQQARASIPPSYRILVVSGDEEAVAQSEALVQYMSAANAFLRVQPTLRSAEARPCLEAGDFFACMGPLTPVRTHWQEPAHIVIKAERIGEGRLRWVCAGAGKDWTPTPNQIAEVDARAAIFGAVEARTVSLRAAMACIRDAGASPAQP